MKKREFFRGGAAVFTALTVIFTTIFSGAPATVFADELSSPSVITAEQVEENGPVGPADAGSGADGENSQDPEQNEEQGTQDPGNPEVPEAPGEQSVAEEPAAEAPEESVTPEALSEDRKEMPVDEAAPENDLIQEDTYEEAMESGASESQEEIQAAGTKYTSGDYEYDVVDGYAKITQYNGTGASLILTIPEKLGGYTVTEIGEKAFYNKTSISKVIFPNTVKDIGEKAFYNCTALTEVILPNNLEKIDFEAFYGCQALTAMTLPQSMKSIGTGFISGTGITEITVPKNVEEACTSYYTSSGLWGGAFEGASKLKTIRFQEGMKTIPEHVCDLHRTETSLTTVVIPSTVTEIGASAFEDCEKLNSLSLPSGLKKIGHSAFAGCKSLESLTLPEGVEELGANIIANTGITEITVPKSVKKAYTQDGGSFGNTVSLNRITFEAGMEKIPDYICDRARSLTEIVLPDSAEVIGEEAFVDCDSLLTIDFKNVETISYNAFGVCDKLETLDFKNVKTIGKSAFCMCISLNNIDLNNVESIGDQAFVKCPFKSIDLKKVKTVGSSAFSECRNLEEINFRDLKVIDWGTFYWCKNLKTVDTMKVETIDEYAFEGCDNLEEVNLKNVTWLGKYAFKDCKKLKDVSMPKMTRICSRAFKGCSVLSSLPLPESLLVIDSGIISGTAISEITIPKNIQELDSSVFEGAENLTTLGFQEGMKTVSCNPYSSNDKITTVKIPDSVTVLLGAFKGFSSLVSVNGMKNVTVIGEVTFAGCTSLETLSLPNGLKKIGAGAFTGCSNLKNLTLPESVEKIGDEAFAGCTDIKSLTLPEGVKLGSEIISDTGITEITVPKNVTCEDDDYYQDYEVPFKGATNLNTITFQEGMKTIPKNICRQSSVKTVNIPDSVTTIDKYAFYECKELVNVDLKKVATVGYCAFIRCEKLNSVKLDNVVTISPYAFCDCSTLSKLDLPESLKTIGSYIIEGTAIAEITVPKNVTGNYYIYPPFEGATNLTTINFQEGMTTIPESICCWENNYEGYESALTKVNIPDSVTAIGEKAFYGCKELVDVDLKNVETVGTEAFYDCKKLKNVKLGKAVTISSNAFNYCQALEELTLPGSIKTIQHWAFANCEGLKTLSCNGNPKDLGENIFKNDNELKIYLSCYSKLFPYAIKYGIPVELDGVEYALMDPEKSFYEINSESNSGYLDMVVRYRITEQFQNDLTVKSVKILLSPDLRLLADSVMIRDRQVEYTLSTKTYYEGSHSIDKTVVIPVEEDEGQIRFTLIPAVGGYDYYSSACLECKYKGEIIEPVIGSLDFKTPVLTAECDSVINTGTFLIKGMTAAEGEVSFTIDGEDAGTVNANKAGLYFKSLTIASPEQGKTYTVSASAMAGNMPYKQELKVTYDTEKPVATEAKLLYYPDSGKEQEYDLLRDDGLVEPIRFSSVDEYKFRIKASNPDKIGSVYVESERNGRISRLEAEWNEALKCFVTEGWFGNDKDYVPGNLSVVIDSASKCLWGIEWIIDPSGYVFSAVTDNTLADITATCYYKDKNSGESISWNASEYGQINPQTTKDDGIFAWDVPEGVWKAGFTSESYLPAETTWLDVPPPHTGIPVELEPAFEPTVEYMRAYEDYVELGFNQYMKPESLKNISLTDSKGNPVAYSLIFDQNHAAMNGNIYTTAFTLSYKDKAPEGDKIHISAGTPVETAYGKTLNIEASELSIDKPMTIRSARDITIKAGEESRIPVEIENGEGKLDKLGVSPQYSSILSADAITASENGGYYIKVTGYTKGSSDIYIYEEGIGSPLAVIPVIVGEETSVGEIAYKHSFFGGESAVGTAPEPVYGTEGSTIKLPDNTFTMSNMKFAGWTDGDKTYKSGDDYTVGKADVLFTAVWETIVITVRVDGVSLNKTKLSLKPGYTETLIATISPNNASNRNVYWHSDKENVAVVDNYGKVTAREYGTAVITVKTEDGGFESSCTVTVSSNGSEADGPEKPEEDEVEKGDLPENVPAPEGIWVGGLASSYPYTGKAVKPGIRVYFGKQLLREKTDYSLTYKNNKKVSATDKSATITIKMKGDYSGSKTVRFDIVKNTLSGSGVSANMVVEAYKAGKKHDKAKPVLTLNGEKLKISSKDLELKYLDATGTKEDSCEAIGSYIIRVSAASGSTNFEGSIDVPMLVTDKGIMSNVKVAMNPKKLNYTGQELKPSFILTDKGQTLTAGTHYTVSCDTPLIDPGKYTLRFMGDGVNYFGVKEYTLKIGGKYDLSNSAYTTVSFNPGEVNASGEAPYRKNGARPKVSVKYRGKTLKEGTDYKVTWKNNKAVAGINSGKAPVVEVFGKGSYKGKASLRFGICKADIGKLVIQAMDMKAGLGSDDYSKAKILFMDELYQDQKLRSKRDYTSTITLSSNTPAVGDTVTISINGMGDNYEGSAETSFRIINKETDLGKAKVKVNAGKAYAYTGKEICPSKGELGITLGGAAVNADGYDITGYYNNVNRGGNAILVIRGKGAYNGVKSVKFKIGQAPVADIWKGWFPLGGNDFLLQNHFGSE